MVMAAKNGCMHSAAMTARRLRKWVALLFFMIYLTLHVGGNSMREREGRRLQHEMKTTKHFQFLFVKLAGQ